ncbi:MAG: glycosyltransferase family 39 protein [Anaerolineae bacterium]|nr:glycosyltransferase family 39 protein [Anaerolineae bacterium]
MRIYDLDWDEGTHLHPDERYLTMVTAALTVPESPQQYWDTTTSPLNPENRGFGGYVYGTLPLFAARAAGTWLDQACSENPPLLPQLVRQLLFGPNQLCYVGQYTGYAGVHLVGRYLSTAADLLTLVALVLLARRLFGERVALLAGLLYAFAVLPIQHAHFFVVDSFATVFVTWTLYLSVVATNPRRDWVLLLAGITTGLAVACKISTWPIAGVVGLAGLVSVEKTDSGTKLRLQERLSTLLFLIASGFLALLAFRVAQPYAFSGPNFWNVSLSPSWLNSMKYIRQLVSGEIDSPPGHQWTSRLPLVFPWVNMVFWGMGLPLGLAAWAGWGFGARTLWRERRLDAALPWLWGTLFFLYQAVQWVKSMRYLLPVYPVFTLFAAWGLVTLTAAAKKALEKQRSPWQTWVLKACRGATGVVVIGAVLWAVAFMQIYVRPFSRVEASRWMFENIPTALTIRTQEGLQIQLPVQPNAILYKEGRPLQLQFSTNVAGTLNYLTLNKVQLSDPATAVKLEVILAADPEFLSVRAQQEVQISAGSSTPTKLTVALQPCTVAANEQLFVQVRLTEGAPITLGTSVLGNEHWDDAMPVRIDGKDPFYDWYKGLSSSSDSSMQMYNNDDPSKWQLLHTWLEEVDYIVLSSNRLYGSIARLPQRYPLTVAYYQALFDGSLGFELAAEFVSFPALGGCQIEDQEAPFTIPPARYTTARKCSIPYPVAEEAFSVYDHPRVLIFAKTAAYSRERAKMLLPLSLTDQAVWMTPKQATRETGTDGIPLVMDAETREVQEGGGTWSAMFKRSALQNRYPVVAVLLWWLVLSLLGWLAFPWMMLLFPALRDRGYGLARMLGLLLWAYPAWLLASLHMVRHTQLLLWGLLLVWAVMTIWLVRRHWSRVREFWHQRWTDLLRIEIIFAVLYTGWVLVRYANPDFYHLVAGGEKPMDLAYLNAVIKSSWFPPYDPWFAGGEMNYYYFGFVLIGSLIKATGILPNVAYNLAIPTLFAMTGAGAYTLAANLASGGESAAPGSARRARRAGIWAVALVVLLGNLGEIQLLIKGLAEIGKVQFESLIPGYQLLVSAAAGFWKVVVKGQALAFRPEWWYWNATRIIPAGPGEGAGPINEFPVFTFLYGDLHAHAISLPLTQIAAGIALQWGLRAAPQWHSRANSIIVEAWRFFRKALPLLMLAGLTAGALQATNTWDYPTYLALMSVSFLLPLLFSKRDAPDADSVAGDGLTDAPQLRFPTYQLAAPLLIWGIAAVLFYPFTSNYIAIYGEVGAWTGRRTTAGEYFLIHGQFVIPLALLAVAQARVMLNQLQHWLGTTPWKELLAVSVGTLLLSLTLLFIGVEIAWIVIPLGVTAALLLLNPHQQPHWRVFWFWVGTALTITLVVELIVLKGDLGRMNTVFKPYMQVWMLFAITAAVAQERLWTFFWNGKDSTDVRLERWFSGRWVWLGDANLSILMLLLLLSALYPVFAIPGKLRDRWVSDAPRTLDGSNSLAFAQHYENGSSVALAPDLALIRWMQDNITGSPTIMEMNAAVEYITWGNRVSIYTGLPSVVGWRWHQVQQRMVMPAGTVELRQADVRAFYDTTDTQVAWRILEQYQIAYVVLTPYERMVMAQPGLEKFDTLVAGGWLEIVYDQNGARLYKVVSR